MIFEIYSINKKYNAMNENNFFSVDRLVEFGMGMAMAQQMVNMMNQTMKQMYVPGSIQSMPNPKQQSPQVFYVGINGQQVGPLNESELIAMINNRSVNKDTLAWMPGMHEWKPIEQVPEILKVIALAPPPINN